MFSKYTLFTTLLIASLTLGNCGEDVIESIDVQKVVETSNPAAVATLTQLRVKESNSPDAVNTYKCTVGYKPIGRLACSAEDSTSWLTPHDIELKMRCPKAGFGATLSFVEIIYSVTSSASVNCEVHEGAVGLGYIGMTVRAWNTVIFNYSAKFFGY